MASTRFSPTICLTHSCNLNCVYCYQQHDSIGRMSFETAKSCIDWIVDNVPEWAKIIEIGFIGGEPLLEFELIKKIIEYTQSKKIKHKYVFYASTNGTLLTDDMKPWLIANKDIFILGLSLDGTKDVQNHNRSNSYNLIDFEFFSSTWPKQGVKMTLSEYSISKLAECIKHIHLLGFSEINGVNLCEGDYDWSSEEYIKMLIPQLEELVEYYVENDTLPLNQLLNRKISACEIKRNKPQKWCGIGVSTVFFDVDGTRRPCPFCTPMTFSNEKLELIMHTDFSDTKIFVDEDCYNNCYIYPICSHCAGANYLTQGSFSKSDKSKCRIQKLIALYAADVQAKRIINNPSAYNDAEKYYTIEAIKKIRKLFLNEFSSYINE